ncbi:GntR family transcriptional regulator [Desulfuribacillus stibiiarsenatis]|uniref:GntR family transcriptional regulator n=1 Tax=Desulfuribacillus stibiiarsenatis TaxID=1390249 RepID=A0A1E5L8L7_9FIRM|nr:GntR family transcriptional regulator [Desulfuribacillus stibiiarsenatis]OEH86490.1 GntR family transcriptional regulator [Desulfuribacillus stibiiarsenatis]
MNIIISNTSPEPLYEQIVRQIKEAIVKGELVSGEPLPSIRNLAKDLNISVITTKRAYLELEREGYITIVSGKGTYVSGQSSELLREKQYKKIEGLMVEIVNHSKVANIEVAELVDLLTLLYKED